MKVKYLLWGACVLAIPFYQTSCTVDKLPDPKPYCDSLTVTYDDHVKPLLDNNCAVSGCHDGSNQLPNLTSYDKLTAINIFSTIRDKVSTGEMPKGGTLTLEEVQLIDCWQDDGFLEKN